MLLATTANNSSTGQDVRRSQPTENPLLQETSESSNAMKEPVPYTQASLEPHINTDNSVGNQGVQVFHIPRKRRCECHCHSRGEYYRTQRREISIIEGFSLSCSWKTPALSSPNCMKCTCSNQCSSIELFIRLPPWLCKSALLGTFSNGPKHVISMSLRPVITIHIDHDIWKFISLGDAKGLIKEISKAHLSPADMTFNDLMFIEVLALPIT
ncbi:hypothetical protein F4810DRAFT_589375 [Camillea tinctor]|nr:hypothetical protein F4810DRAFT_589375 [Camillea tinctor]